jgi:transcription antitermination protein NusB
MVVEKTENNTLEEVPKPKSKGASQGSRRKSRQAALQALFLMEMNTDKTPAQSLETFLENFPVKGKSQPFFSRLYEGVCEHKGEIDYIIQGHSEHWRLERMSRVDCNILRLAVFELVYCSDVPPRVAINEAIDLGKQFGSDESGAFINGILDSIFLEKYGKLKAKELDEQRKI